jgi:hypothetical protein
MVWVFGTGFGVLQLGAISLARSGSLAGCLRLWCSSIRIASRTSGLEDLQETSEALLTIGTWCC